jgi:hypothetical protein
MRLIPVRCATGPMIKQRMRRSPRAKKTQEHALALQSNLAPLTEDRVAELTELAVKLGHVFKKPLVDFPNQLAFEHARHFHQREPVLYAQAYQLLLSGLPPHVVHQRIRGNTYNEICEVRRLYPELIVAGRQAIVHNLEEASLMFSNRLVNEGQIMSIDKVAQNLAILIEKTQLLTGGVTSRQEHLSAPKPEDLKAMFDALPAADAEVIPSTQ